MMEKKKVFRLKFIYISGEEVIIGNKENRSGNCFLFWL